MEVSDARPRYLRFTRSLTLAVGVLVAPGCASVVRPDGGETPDVVLAVDRVDPVDRVAPGDAVTGVDVVSPPDAVGPDAVVDAGPCPPTRPPFGATCAPVGLQCNYGMPCVDDIECMGANPGAPVGTWQSRCLVGPLPPPELLAATGRGDHAAA